MSVPLPRVVDPSTKLTEPVGMVEFPVGPVTVAVNVTCCPLVEGLSEDCTTADVAALFEGFTV